VLEVVDGEGTIDILYSLYTVLTIRCTLYGEGNCRDSVKTPFTGGEGTIHYALSEDTLYRGRRYYTLCTQ
jgi:hypothetical protein